MKRHPTQGFTLLELMIAVAIVAILAGFALPAYEGYIETSRRGAMTSSISTMTVFQEDVRLRTGSYVAGSYTNGVPDAALAVLDWEPNEADVDYVVTINGGTSYDVTATDEAGVTLCVRYPAGDPCP